jgi:hypothetical protein
MLVYLLDQEGTVLESFPAEAASVLGGSPRRVPVTIGPAGSNADVTIPDGQLLERVASCRAEVTEMDLDGPTD